MTTDAVAGRRRARRNDGEPASLALSLLDIVSAGFGAAVFLFVVFAALPLGEPRPGGGGGSSFIDLHLEWDRPEIEPVGAPATDITAKLNELSGIYADWRIHTHMFDDGNPLEYALRAEVYGTETELRETLKIDLTRVELSVVEELKSLTEKLRHFLTPYLDATCSNLFKYKDSFSAFLEESPHFDELCRIFSIDHIGQPPADRRDRPIYYPAEPSAPDLLKFVADYAREFYDDERIRAISVDVGQMNETLNALSSAPRFASLSVSAANDGSPAAAAARIVDPKLSVQIIYVPPGESGRKIALTGPEKETKVDPETDALILAGQEEAPWDAAFVTGYDFYGNYSPRKISAERELFVRILNPAPGAWSFQATVLDRDGMEKEFPDLGLRAALTCPDADTSGIAREEVIPLYPPENNVIEILRSPCRVTGSG